MPEGPHEVECSFNPTDYTLTQTVALPSVAAPATEGGHQQYAGTGAMTFTTNLFFDAFSEAKGDVTPKITTLLGWMKPTKESGRSRATQPAAGTVPVGRQPAAQGPQGAAHQRDRAVHVVPDRTGRRCAPRSRSRSPATPSRLRARTRPRVRPTAGASTSVIEGDTLQSVAYRELGKPAYWRAIADLNGIDDPMRVRARERPPDPERRRRGPQPLTAPMPAPSVSIERLIEIDGQRIPPSLEFSLESATVVDRLAMPDMFTLVFRDPDRTILGDNNIEVGTEVKISTTSSRDTDPLALIDAEVTSIETDYGSHGTLAVVRGYDLSHRLVAGRKSKTFQNAKYSDIASQVASAAGADRRRRRDRRDRRPRVPGQPVGPRLPLLPRPPGRLRLPSRRQEAHLQTADRVVQRTGRGRGRDRDAHRARVGQHAARLLGTHERGRPGRQGRGPWLGSKGKTEIVGKADATATNAELPMTPADLAAKIGGQTQVVVNHGVVDQQRSGPARQRQGRADRLGRLRGHRGRRRGRPRSRPASRSASVGSTQP